MGYGIESKSKGATTVIDCRWLFATHTKVGDDSTIGCLLFLGYSVFTRNDNLNIHRLMTVLRKRDVGLGGLYVAS